MRAIRMEDKNMKLGRVQSRIHGQILEISMEARKWKVLPSRPCLLNKSEGTLGPAIDGLGSGLLLKISVREDPDVFINIVLQPETPEEQTALAGDVFEKSEVNNLTLLFVPTSEFPATDILKNPSI